MGSHNEVHVLSRRLHDLVKRWYLTRTSNDGARSLHSVIQSRHAIEYHFPLLRHARRSIDGETSLAQFVCLCVSSSPCSLYTSSSKTFVGGEERRRPNCVFRFSLARRCSAAPEEKEGRLGRQKRREIKTKWNVLLSPGYPFYSYHNDNPPFLTCSRADGRTVRAYFLLRLPKFH